MPGPRVQAVANYVRSLNDFTIATCIDAGYDHMGALILDGILQAGIHYDAVVRPRVKQLRARHPAVRTTTGFLALLDDVGPVELYQWQGAEKNRRIVELARFFRARRIESQADLRDWLTVPEHVEELKAQRGVGDKTADYFRILVGMQTAAVDRHLVKFVEDAGITGLTYEEVRRLIEETADLLGIDRAYLDHSIWKYMSGKAMGRRRGQRQQTSECRDTLPLSPRTGRAQPRGSLAPAARHGTRARPAPPPSQGPSVEVPGHGGGQDHFEEFVDWMNRDLQAGRSIPTLGGHSSFVARWDQQGGPPERGVLELRLGKRGSPPGTLRWDQVRAILERWQQASSHDRWMSSYYNEAKWPDRPRCVNHFFAPAVPAVIREWVRIEGITLPFTSRT